MMQPSKHGAIVFHNMALGMELTTQLHSDTVVTTRVDHSVELIL